VEPRRRKAPSRLSPVRVRLSLISLLGLLVMIAPTAAHAGSLVYFKDRAYFQATIAGTYTARDTVVTTSCHREPAVDQVEPITVTTTGDETLHFTSIRSVRLEADRYLDNSVQMGTLNRRTPIVVTTTKTLVRSAPCTPGESQPVCGTRTTRLGISLVGLFSPLRLVYNITPANSSKEFFPDEPFEGACGLPLVPWWGKLSSPPAKISAAQIFNRRRPSLLLSGHVAKSANSIEGGDSIHGVYEISYTVKLVRVRH
jgi:hypothetical protein